VRRRLCAGLDEGVVDTFKGLMVGGFVDGGVDLSVLLLLCPSICPAWSSICQA